MAHRLLILFTAPLLAQEFHNPVVIPNSARTDRGTLEFRTANDQRGAKLRAAATMAGDYTMDLPDALGATGDCIKLIATSVLGFGSCGSGGGWTLTTDELSPVDTSATLRVNRSTNGQGLGSFAKPWSGVWSTTFQAPNAAGTDAKMTLNSTSLTGADTSGNTKVSIVFNSGSISTRGTITSTGVAGADHDAWYVLKNAALGGSNWRWALSHRADGRQLWFYAYDGTNFSIPLKMNPSGNSVCVNCPGDATAGYSLDVGGSIITDGVRGKSPSGYLNAPYVEVRDPSTGFHWGHQARVDVTGERSMTVRGPNGETVWKLWTMQSGGNRIAAYLYGDLETVGDVLPDADAGASSGRKLGGGSRRWYEAHARYAFIENLAPKSGNTDINFTGHLMPIGTRDIGASAARVANLYVTNLDVSGACTGCGGGSSKWTTSGATMFPTTATSFLEIIPSTGVQQSIGSQVKPWLSMHALAHYVPNASGSALRASLSASGLILYDSVGTEKFYLGSADGGMEVHGTLRLMNLGGGGNAQACINATGQIYRGTPGC